MDKRTSDHLWHAETKDLWLRFMGHDKDNPSRQAAYHIISDLLTEPMEFAEIGYGSCIDFRNAWKGLHDQDRMHYRGFDTSKDFCMWARAEFFGYDFEWASLLTLNAFRRADLVYVRHIFEHAHPDEYQDWIRAALRFAKRSAVFVWFLAPQKGEHLTYPGAWNNTYCRATVENLIHDEGFSLEVQELSQSEHVYIMRRQ